jgi:hypothetical protein
LVNANYKKEKGICQEEIRFFIKIYKKSLDKEKNINIGRKNLYLGKESDIVFFDKQKYPITGKQVKE